VRYSTGAQRGGVNTFFDLVEPSSLETIEILRGPNSAEYGSDASLAVWAEQGAGGGGDGEPVPASAVVVADLSGWRYRTPRGTVALDPVLGRLMFPPSQVPKKGVRVSYRYGFAADLGGGEYLRGLRDPYTHGVSLQGMCERSAKSFQHLRVV